MHDDVSTYFALVYWRREPVLVMKRVKGQAMFWPSWKFEGKRNLIPPQFFVLCFCVFVFSRGSSFSRSSFSRGSSFSRSSFSRGSSFSRSSFSRGSSFSRSSFSRGSSFSRSLVFGLRFLDTHPYSQKLMVGTHPIPQGLLSSVTDDDEFIICLPELKSNLDICRAYASHSFLLKLKIITGWKFLSIIIFTILKQFEGPKTNGNCQNYLLWVLNLLVPRRFEGVRG